LANVHVRGIFECYFKVVLPCSRLIQTLPDLMLSGTPLFFKDIPLIFPEVDLISVNDYDEIMEANRVEGGKTWALKLISGL
jgi:hypothetical protein